MEIAKDEETTAASKGYAYWLIPVAIVAGYWYLTYQDAKSSYRDLMQQILDENITGNSLAVDYLTVPITDAMPFSGVMYSLGVFSPEFGGFFTLKRKDGAALGQGCNASTIDYTIRRVGGERVVGQIDGLSLMKVRGCN